MIVGKILYSDRFTKRYRRLSEEIKKIAKKKVEIFKISPLHPSLRLHELHGEFSGTWSISLNTNYRIIFERMPNGDIVFQSIGKHDIYKNLNS